MPDGKRLLVRMSEDQKAMIEFISRIDGTSQNRVMCAAIDLFIEAKRNDKAFRRELQRRAERDQALGKSMIEASE